MDDTEFAQRRKKLEDELSQIEREAGITPEAAEKAWGLAFIPYGVLGDEMREFTAGQNSTLHFDNEHDDNARRVRNLYFGVADADARAKLISKRLELDDLRDRSCRDDVDKAKRALWEAQQKESDRSDRGVQNGGSIFEAARPSRERVCWLNPPRFRASV